MMQIIRTLFRDGAASVLLALCELFLRILWIRERRVGIFSSADEVSDGQGIVQTRLPSGELPKAKQQAMLSAPCPPEDTHMEQINFFTDDAPALQPLASRLRPQSLEEFAGQTHLLGEG